LVRAPAFSCPPVWSLTRVLTLIGVGDISDHIGRRATMLMGLGPSLAGTVLFAVAPDVLWLFAARL
jgi:MFS family permease